MIIIMVISIIVIISLSILILLTIISTAIIQIRSKERARCFACEQNSRLLLGTKCEMRQISVWTALRELEMAKPRIRDWDSVDWERWECEKESKSIKSRRQNHKQNIGTERGEGGVMQKMLTVECGRYFLLCFEIIQVCNHHIHASGLIFSFKSFWIIVAAMFVFARCFLWMKLLSFVLFVSWLVDVNR